MGIVCPYLEVFNWDLDGRNRATSYGEMKSLKIELFQKLTATFPLYLSNRILTKVRKLKIFPWNNLVRKKRISVETWMKKLTRVFFGEEWVATSETQYCLRVSSMWEIKKDIFQNIYFQTNFAFSDPGDSSIEKKKLKKGQLLPIIFRKTNRSMISTFKEDQKLPTSVTSESCIIKDNKRICRPELRFLMGSFRKKNYDYWIKIFLFKFFSAGNIIDR